MSGLVIWFEDLGKEDIALAGGKGANLGELVKAKMPVPPGFVISAQAYKEFIETADLKKDIMELMKDLDVNDTDKLAGVSVKIKKLIQGEPMPDDIKKQIKEAYEKLSEDAIKLAGEEGDGEYVAVRSSATAEDLPDASFAGQNVTLLNVSGLNDLYKAVKGCWASLFEPRSIFYRVEKGFRHEKVLMSVIVQKMIDSESAGVMFTINPIDGDRDKMAIEAAFGLGEVVVGGKLTPDRYIVDKSTLALVDKVIEEKPFLYTRDMNTGKTVRADLSESTAKKQVLTEEEVKGIAELGKEIEEHYGFPQDIEWAIEEERIYIVQSRPVTTFIKPENEEEQIQPEAPVEEATGENILVKGFSASPGIGAGKVVQVHEIAELHNVRQGDVLVTKMTSPDMVPAMERAAAIVTDEGGTTCHAAIVSRELGIPCIVGTDNATQVLADGMEITVDGGKGVVRAGIEEVQKPVEEAFTPEEVPETRTKIYVNLGIPDKAEEVARLPVDGVGLMREEFIFATKIGEHPLAMIERGEEQKFIDTLAEGIAAVARAFNPRPVILRLSDFKTNEYKDLDGGEKFEENENNPMIGWRGCSRYITEKYAPAFRLELRAVKKVRDGGLKNVWIMLPFVRKTSDVTEVTKLMEEEGLHRGPDLKLWMMAEVPSNAILAEDFAKLVDGFSIGSNDLTQLIMGADRDSELLQRLGYFDERDPAVKKTIAHLIKVAKDNNITCSICGQAPSVYPEFTKFLVEGGITSISANPDAAVKTKKLVAEEEQKLK